MANYDSIDEAMLPFHVFASALSAFDGFIDDEEAGVKMSLSNVTLELPVLIDIVGNGDGVLTLGASPPLYYEATGVESIYHQIRLTVTLSEPERF